MTFDSVRKWIELKIKKRSVLYIPGPCLSSFLVVKPSKTTSFPIKKRVMWVPGTPIMGISMMTSQSLNVTQIKSLRISPSILAYVYTYIWSNYSDLTRPHTKWWFSKGNPLISGKPRLVKYYNLARYIKTYISWKSLQPLYAWWFLLDDDIWANFLRKPYFYFIFFGSCSSLSSVHLHIAWWLFPFGALMLFFDHENKSHGRSAICLQKNILNKKTGSDS